MKQSIEERIYARLKDMVAIDSVSYSAAENAMSDYALRFFSDIPYLKERPDQFGLHVIEGDAFGRTVPYALLLGNSPNTVVSMGHIDVVGTESYGELSRQAYELEMSWSRRWPRWIFPKKHGRTWIPTNGSGAAVQRI